MTGERGEPSRGGLLSGAYGRITGMRRTWYARRPERRRRLHHSVISVGNLATGGSGKTPVVAAVAGLLRNRGERPAILTRGYARRESTEGVLVVSDGEATSRSCLRAPCRAFRFSCRAIGTSRGCSRSGNSGLP